MGVESDLTQALYSLLAGDAPLDGATLAIYTGSAPQATDSGSAAQFPYVLIAEHYAVEYSDATHTGFEFFVTLATYSRSNTREETEDIQGLIRAALHRKENSLSVAGHTVVLCDWIRSGIAEPVDFDGAWQGDCEYRLIVTKDAAD